MRLETVGKQMERNWKGLENLRGVKGSGGDGSNARSRGKCQADGTDGVRYMVFVLKTRKYGSENDFLIENCRRNWKILKDVNK